MRHNAVARLFTEQRDHRLKDASSLQGPGTGPYLQKVTYSKVLTPQRHYTGNSVQLTVLSSLQPHLSGERQGIRFRSAACLEPSYTKQNLLARLWQAAERSAEATASAATLQGALTLVIEGPTTDQGQDCVIACSRRQ